MSDDLSLLTTALALSPTRARAVADRWPGAGGLVGLWFGGPDALAGVLPRAARRRLDAWLTLSDRALATRPPPARLTSAADVATYFRPLLGLKSRESFWAVLLDVRGGVIGVEKIAEGTLTSCVVHPREVFATAIRARAAHLILVHNHPSGDPEPSPEDVSLTDVLTRAGQVVGIPVVDHVVVARAGFRSIGVPQLGSRRGRHSTSADFSPGEPVCEYAWAACGAGPSSRSRRSPRRARERAASTSSTPPTSSRPRRSTSARGRST